ncbi:hypothetical protein LTR99_011088 [Exophiala xenobiotica]|uniref:Uncharacterized protein n=1 Tax=Vermiconidia calcicola TaxID=1690605 RepID=A0AAV9PRI7_9PEZI|nr:hypothetical protein LTR92_011130 [Exophiala xenobiotica]KAK5527568.1 hypothetical protein LTR25_011073 [Vermiconidia calcicola]KAK5528790.1 hypothetical protein LTR23_010913 [Chaetothyriales sp. CCFEE 6169]KAK5215936.1 hypothetical protein LTR72_011061 [Exophiala xenobiotica]KAK5218444.1 hypothetical protein LTR47_011740 [Exophiala xenobiotica]
MSKFSQIYADELKSSTATTATAATGPLRKRHINEQEQPSHGAVEVGNPASFKPKYLVLDDINIELITVFAAVSTAISIFVLGTPGLLTAAATAAIILPLRAFFPRPTTPQGLVLITGASSGIGAELSYIFAEHGHNLVLVGRNKEQLENVKTNVETKYVNNAGLGAAGETMEQPIELAERMTTLNCIALVPLTLLFGSDMLKCGRGWLLHVSSVGARNDKSSLGCLASPGQNVYHATKHLCANSPSLSPSSYAVTLGSSTPN